MALRFRRDTAAIRAREVVGMSVGTGDPGGPVDPAMVEELQKLRNENKTQKEGITAGNEAFNTYVDLIGSRENRRKQLIKEKLPNQWEIIQPLLGDDEEGTAAAAARLHETFASLANPTNSRELAELKRKNIKLDKLSERREARHKFNAEHEKQRAENFEATKDRLLRDYMTTTYGSRVGNNTATLTAPAKYRDVFLKNANVCNTIWAAMSETVGTRYCPACSTQVNKAVSCSKVYPHR